MYGKELFIRFTVRVFRERLSFFFGVSFIPFWFLWWDMRFDCIPERCLSIYFRSYISDLKFPSQISQEPIQLGL